MIYEISNKELVASSFSDLPLSYADGTYAFVLDEDLFYKKIAGVWTSYRTKDNAVSVNEIADTLTARLPNFKITISPDEPAGPNTTGDIWIDIP